MKYKIMLLVIFNCMFIGGYTIGKIMIKNDISKSKVELQVLNESLKEINENAKDILDKCDYQKKRDIFISLYRAFRLSPAREIGNKINYADISDRLLTACLINSIGNIIIIIALFCRKRKIIPLPSK